MSDVLPEPSALPAAGSSSAMRDITAIPESVPPEQLGVSKLMELLERSAARRVLAAVAEDRGLAESVPFPFAALVGQVEMKLALLLALINPRVGGVLLIGPRGTGKTSAVRGLVDLLPFVERSTCAYGCTPEAAEAGGMGAICDECAQKLARGEPITARDRMRLVELPLNARLEDVIGGLDERQALEHQRVRLERGLLSHADLNLLYIDEVNLLGHDIIDAILDAAAQGQYTVHRGVVAATYRARIVLIGSMNPEEGHLRPQILDRFGLRVVLRGLADPAERYEVYERARLYQENPWALRDQWFEDTMAMGREIQQARAYLGQVSVAPEAARYGLGLIGGLQIDSHRAEMALFEAARARAAADGRPLASVDDVRAVAPLALRQRRSPAFAALLEAQQREDEEIRKLLQA
jgi:magnesium chelatase subunit I